MLTQILYTYISEEDHDYLINRYLNKFPHDFQKKILAYRQWQDAQLFLLGRLLLRYGLQKYGINQVEDTINYTSYNKPFLTDCDIKFNISHAGEVVICVLSDCNDVGIDVEIMQDISIEDFESQMTTLERDLIMQTGDTKSAFFDYWTQKEAVIKANGKGLSIPLKSFQVIDKITKINDEVFFLKEIYLGEKYKCHVAFKDKTDTSIAGPSLIKIHDL